MKYQSKLRSKLFLGLFILATVAGCKKDNAPDQLSDAQQIENAKTWFINQQKSQTTSFKDREGKMLQLSYVPEWEQAAIELIDGKTVITANVKTNLQSVYGNNTYFSLVIKYDGSSYEAKTLKVSSFDGENKHDLLNETQLYQAAFTNDDLSKDGVEAEIKTYNSHLKSDGAVLYTATGKTMIRDQPASDWRPYTLSNVNGKKILTTNVLPKTMQTYCYDAYMVTRVYEDGILVDIYQEYMGFQICREIDSEYINPTDLNGVGGIIDPPVEENEVNIEWGDVDDTDISITTVVDTVKNVSWYCYSAHGGAIKFKSYEQITANTFRTGAFHVYTRQYNIKSLSHISLLAEGTITGQDVNAQYAYHQDQSTSSLAKITLVFKDKRSYVQHGTNHYKYSGDKTAYKSWSKESLGWQDRTEID